MSLCTGQVACSLPTITTQKVGRLGRPLPISAVGLACEASTRRSGVSASILSNYAPLGSCSGAERGRCTLLRAACVAASTANQTVREVPTKSRPDSGASRPSPSLADAQDAALQLLQRRRSGVTPRPSGGDFNKALLGKPWAPMCVKPLLHITKRLLNSGTFLSLLFWGRSMSGDAAVWLSREAPLRAASTLVIRVDHCYLLNAQLCYQACCSTLGCVAPSRTTGWTSPALPSVVALPCNAIPTLVASLSTITTTQVHARLRL